MKNEKVAKVRIIGLAGPCTPGSDNTSDFFSRASYFVSSICFISLHLVEFHFTSLYRVSANLISFISFYFSSSLFISFRLFLVHLVSF